MDAPSEANVLESAGVESLYAAIESLSSDIAALKAKIGEHYWQAFLSDGQREPELSEAFDGIQTKIDEITSLEQEIQLFEDGAAQPIQPPVQLQIGPAMCRSCGTVNERDAKFCQSCGMAAQEGSVSESEAKDCEICPLCGASLHGDAIFCYTCGARVKI